jgi:hypothetical protein
LQFEADKRPQSVQAWFKDLGLSIPKKAKPSSSWSFSINWPVFWTGFTAIVGLLTAFGITDFVKQKLNPSPVPTVSPQPSPSSKP